MSDVLVVFGSRSDADVYNKVVKELHKAHVECELRALSAHRTPEELAALIKREEFSVVIAGAGLSAALPGIIASRTLKPVIGIPVHGNYSGLDALLSIMQMPPGIPVLAVGVNKADIAAEQATNMLRVYDSVNLIGPKKDDVVKRAIDTLNKLKVEYKFSDKPDNTAVNIEFTCFDKPIEEKDVLVVYCPMLLKKDDKAEAALNILKHSTHGLWVGLNRGENAAIAACEILNINGRFDKALKGLREEYKESVLEHDRRLER